MRSLIGICIDVNGETPTKMFVPKYSLGWRSKTRSRPIILAKPIQSLVGSRTMSSCPMTAFMMCTWVSM